MKADDMLEPRRDDSAPSGAGVVPADLFRVRLRDTKWFQTTLVVLSLVMAVVVWHLIVVIFDVKAYILPAPLSVAQSLGVSASRLFVASLLTLQETVYGFLIATAVGIPLAAAIATSKIVERVAYPLLVLSNAVPKIALAPVFLAWFGLGAIPRVLIAALLAVFPIVINTVVGLVGVDSGLILLGRSTKAKRWRIFLQIRFPGALPGILSGLKIGITLALTGAVVGEFLGGNGGLGYIITNAQGNLQLSLAFAAIVILSVMGIVLFYLIEFLEKAVAHGHKS